MKPFRNGKLPNIRKNKYGIVELVQKKETDMSRQKQSNVYRIDSSTQQRRTILRSDVEQQRVSPKVWIRRLQARVRRCKNLEHKARLGSDIEYLRSLQPKRTAGYTGMEESEPESQQHDDELPAGPPVLRRSDYHDSDSDSDSDGDEEDEDQARS